jgi:hypothetical protein
MYEQSRRNESEQNIPGAREEEHRHISSVQRLQATLTPLKDHLVSQWDSTASIKAKQDGEMHTPSTSPPTPLTVLSSSTVLQHATCLELVPRFYYLYAQALICVQCNGPYSLDKHKFLVYTSMPTVRLSENQLAQSLALAQDCCAATQSYHLAPEDLEIHSMLGKTTIIALEGLLDLGELTMEPLAWGILGLSSGYTSSDSLFDAYRQQLYTALNSLPTTGCEWNPSDSVHRIAQAQTGYVTKQSGANRQIHISAIMLLQIMRKDWTRLGWYHGVQVAKRWIEHLGIEK